MKASKTITIPRVEFPYPLSWKILKTPWREGLINFTLSLSPLSFSCGIRDGFQGTVQHASANSPSHCHAGVIKRRRGYLWHWEQERGERQQGLPWSRRQRPLFNSSLVRTLNGLGISLSALWNFSQVKATFDIIKCKLLLKLSGANDGVISHIPGHGSIYHSWHFLEGK